MASCSSDQLSGADYCLCALRRPKPAGADPVLTVLTLYGLVAQFDRSSLDNRRNKKAIVNN
jgi:hypothetical protein